MCCPRSERGVASPFAGVGRLSSLLPSEWGLGIHINGRRLLPKKKAAAVGNRGPLAPGFIAALDMCPDKGWPGLGAWGWGDQWLDDHG